MNETPRECVVIGGGISGLTAAWLLKKAGVDVCLMESTATVGGCTQTEHRAGFLLEKGPFNVIVRDPAFEALLDDFSDEIKVITAGPSAKHRYIYRRGSIHRVPSHPFALATSKLLSVRGRARLLTGLLLSARAGPFEQTIEQAATRRFGSEAADTLVSAAISGIFAGDTRKLSVDACFPSVRRIDREARSLIGYGLTAAMKSMWQRKNRPKRRWRGMVSLDGGLGALTGALGRRLGADLMTQCQVRKLERNANGHEVTFQAENGETRTVQCRHVFSALTAAATARLLQPTLPEAGNVLASIESASMVVLNLGFRREDVGHPLDGFGFLVPNCEAEFPLMGVLWSDSAFPHHAPADRRLLRVFIGGSRDPSAVARSDDELIATAMGALRELLSVKGDPCLIDVCRHKSTIPQYHEGHREKIERLRAVVGCVPGLHLIGNYLEGVSLNDCIRLSARVAGEVLQETEHRCENRDVDHPVPLGQSAVA